jgi:thymidylate synthase (FAD)
MKVQLLSNTAKPEKVIATAAKVCYSPGTTAEVWDAGFSIPEFIDKLISMGHMSPFEHASFTFGIDGISRACSHQLVRHRIASFSQQSQRYVTYSAMELTDFVAPDPIIEGSEDAFSYYTDCLDDISQMYEGMVEILVKDGFSKTQAAENARYLLPNAMTTNLVMTMNARELMHFFELRCCRRAQEEINQLAWTMLETLRSQFPTIFEDCGPNCLTSKCKEGKMSCGSPYQKKLPGM